MGSFSWTRADLTTKRSNLTYGDKYKILVPKEFGGGYIKDVYFDYGQVFYLQNDVRFKDLYTPIINSKCDGYFVYVNAEGQAKHFKETADLYGILAYWNGCSGMDYEGGTYPKLIEDILVLGKTYDQSNRCKGIEIGCYMDQIDALKYPLKLVSVSYAGTYEDCKGRSYGDPDQGFCKGKWTQHIYEKYLMKLEDLEDPDIEPPTTFKTTETEDILIREKSYFGHLSELIHVLLELSNRCIDYDPETLSKLSNIIPQLKDLTALLKEMFDI